MQFIHYELMIKKDKGYMEYNKRGLTQEQAEARFKLLYKIKSEVTFIHTPLKKENMVSLTIK